MQEANECYEEEKAEEAMRLYNKCLLHIGAVSCYGVTWCAPKKLLTAEVQEEINEMMMDCYINIAGERSSRLLIPNCLQAGLPFTP